MPYSGIAASPLESFVVSVFPLGVILSWFDVIDPVDGHSWRDVVVKHGWAVRDLRNHHAMRNGALSVCDKLTMKEKMRGVLARIHGESMVVDESLVRSTPWRATPTNTMLSSRRFGSTGRYPAIELDLWWFLEVNI